MTRAERRRRARGIARMLADLPPPPATARWYHRFLRWRWLVALIVGGVASELLHRWGWIR